VPEKKKVGTVMNLRVPVGIHGDFRMDLRVSGNAINVVVAI